MDELLNKIAETIKNLPVNVDTFDDADRWVGCVVALQKMAQEVNANGKPSD